MMHLSLLHVTNLGVVFIVHVVFIVEAMLIFWAVFILGEGVKKVNGEIRKMVWVKEKGGATIILHTTHTPQTQNQLFFFRLLI